MFKQDYMMRQIETLSRAVAKLVFRKDSPAYTAGQEQTGEADGLYFAIHTLVEQGRINEAENLLYEKSDLEDIRYLEIALDFYAGLNQLPDKVLETGGFAREEIEEGLKDIMEQFGVALP